MDKYITYATHQDGAVHAKTEAEYKAEGISEGWDDYVWQMAESKEAAIVRHDEAVDLWRDDLNHGRPEKDTY